MLEDKGHSWTTIGHAVRSTLLAVVIAVMATTAPAFAGGGEKGDWELGPYIGYSWLDDYGRYLPKNAPIFGGRLGYFFTPNWSFEVSGQRTASSTKLDTLGVTDVDIKLDALRLNGLYNFAAGQRFRPFLTAGAGREKTDLGEFGETSDWGWNAGAGFRWFMTPRVNLRADGRLVGIKPGEQEIDEMQKNVEATLGLNFVFGGGYTEPVAVVPPVTNQRPTVSCTSDRSEILPGESVNLRAAASDPDGDALTYVWSTTAGRVSGTGAAATFDFTGATAPATATVTVRVSDGHGNDASSNCSVGLREPVRPAEAVSCLAGGFARNLARLNNVDKACLDDVAQRLKADPQARVIAIGHTDGRESPATSIGDQRADAVKAYLVSEQGIEASRITVRSIGATKPLDTGTDATAQARNRRVEVWFVPQGATVPE